MYKLNEYITMSLFIVYELMAGIYELVTDVCKLKISIYELLICRYMNYSFE